MPEVGTQRTVTSKRSPGRRAPAPVRAVDLDVLAKAVRLGRHRSVARLAGSSVLADRGIVWPVVTATLVPWRTTRPAGVAGLSAVGATATLGHAAKLVIRRRRPPRSLRMLARAPGRRPTTWSFPSGHTANAFAFATAAGCQQPLTVTVLGPFAAAVAFTRVTTARHHPSDVAASLLLGCAVGAGVGAAVRSWTNRGAKRDEAPLAPQ
jgi:membrane-associated phospholipid phosphatase